MRFVHDRSEMWTSPSMPSSTSTNAPKSVRLRTLPLSREPTGYFSASCSQGFGSICFRPRLMRCASWSMSSTSALDLLARP